MEFYEQGSASSNEVTSKAPRPQDPSTQATTPQPQIESDDYFMIFLPKLAELLGGADEAVVLQRFIYWSGKSKHSTPDGSPWFWNGYKEWLAQFPWLKSKKSIARIVLHLEQMDILRSKRLDELLSEGLELKERDKNNPWNRHKWYSINFDRLSQLLGSSAASLIQKLTKPGQASKPARLRNCPKQENGIDQNKNIELVNLGNSLPYTNNEKNTNKTGETPVPQFPQTPSPTQLSVSLISFKEKDSVVSQEETSSQISILLSQEKEELPVQQQNQDQSCIHTQKSDLAETVLVSVGGYKPVNQLAQQQSLSIYLNSIEEIYQEVLEKNCKPVQVLKGRLFPWQRSKVTRDFDEKFLKKVAQYLQTTPNFRIGPPKVDDAKDWLSKAAFHVERLEQAIALWQNFSSEPVSTCVSAQKKTPTPEEAYIDPDYMPLGTHQKLYQQLQKLGETAFGALGIQQQIYLQWKQRAPHRFSSIERQLKAAT